MGLFSKKQKSPRGITLLVMKLMSPHEVQAIWDVVYSDTEVLGRLIEHGLAPDLATSHETSTLGFKTQIEYQITGRPGAIITYYAEFYQSPGFVSINVSGDTEAVEDAQAAFTELEPIIAGKLPGVQIMTPTT